MGGGGKPLGGAGAVHRAFGWGRGASIGALFTARYRILVCGTWMYDKPVHHVVAGTTRYVMRAATR